MRRRKEGRLTQAAITISPIRERDGRLIGGSVIARDITERKLAEAALQEANQELEAFSYSVSHDLRAPLRGLRAMAEVLLEDYAHALDDTGREYARHLSQAAAQMDALTANLLAYSRVDRADMRLEPVALDRVVAEAVDRLAIEIAARSARIIVAPHLPSVLGDEAILEQIVGNLVSNAIKFTRPGVKPEVEIRAEE